MFCPKCAAQNTEEARFCRSCGTDISLVPQAMSGVLAEKLAAGNDNFETRVRRKHARREQKRASAPINIERAVRSLFMGFAFIFVSFAVKTWMPAGSIWWFWLLIPAFGMLADGVSTFIRLSEEKKQQQQLAARPFYAPPPTAVPHAPRVNELSQRDTGEMIPPPSVTEGTTRHLGVPVERKRGEE